MNPTSLCWGPSRVLGRVSPTARRAPRPIYASPTPNLPSESWSTCKNCKKPFLPSQNHPGACHYHPDLYTGGEAGKYIGFVRFVALR